MLFVLRAGVNDLRVYPTEWALLNREEAENQRSEAAGPGSHSKAGQEPETAVAIPTAESFVSGFSVCVSFGG